VKFPELIPEISKVNMFEAVSPLKKVLAAGLSSRHHVFQAAEAINLDGFPGLSASESRPLKENRIIGLVVRLAVNRRLVKALGQEPVPMPDVKIHRSPDPSDSVLLPHPSGRLAQEIRGHGIIVNTLEKANCANWSSVGIPQVGIHHGRDSADDFPAGQGQEKLVAIARSLEK
jgi:hypothetical protein